MDKEILEYLEIYKKLDQLCKQILSSERGVSQYIDEMSYESQGYRIAGWESDYKQLKKMRWIRNRLVHEIDSFKDNLVNTKDIEWLQNFYSRIMERTDPFSLLYQLQYIDSFSSLHQCENMNQIAGGQEEYPEIYFPTNKASISSNEDLPDGGMNLVGMILLGIILAVVILIGIAILGIVYLKIFHIL